MARDEKAATKLARDLPKYGDILKMKKGIVPTISGHPRYLELFWDISPEHKQAQVFILKGKIDGKDFECQVAKQALEHYLRAV